MKIWVDGSGWNGKRAGWLVYTEIDGATWYFYTRGRPRTNNEMEYEALIRALELFANPGDEIYSDSNLIVQQVMGTWGVFKPHLKKLRKKAEQLLTKKKCSLHWIPREENKAGKLLEIRNRNATKNLLNSRA